MPTEFDAMEDVRYAGLYLGVVTHNDDPRTLGRVRIRIPGLIEPFSAWALPLGTIGGGAAQRGFYDPPDVGADVAVMFHQGDTDAPVYWSGHWGLPDAGAETPTRPLEESDPKLAPQAKTYETARFQMVFDDRESAKTWFILDKQTGDVVEMSDANGIRVQSKGVVRVEAAGNVEVESTGGQVSVDASGAVDVNAGGNVTVDGSQILLNGAIPVGRVGDAVQVTIPPGIFHVTNPVQPGPPTIPAPVPVTVPGVIVSGSGTVKAG